ncbi:MAG: hypothetical protein Q4C50_09885 [Eubacteriales bacterium]|nr:hypothetical protein [Eubacteriales bacterium]
MQYKKWCFGILGVIAAVVLFIAGMNYFVDPFGYFTFQSGDYNDVDFKILDTQHYQRVLKLQHVLHFKDQYDAYILGGSKTGAFCTEKLQEMDGYRYYNMYEFQGTLPEYEMLVEFLLENAAPKKIIVNFSGAEVHRIVNNNESVVMQNPALLTGESQIGEYLDFLMKDVRSSFEVLADQVKNGKPETVHNYTGGERNLDALYNSRRGNTQMTAGNVLRNYESRLERIFADTNQAKYSAECLEVLQNIKSMCDENGVELMVWFAPTFITGTMDYEGTAYREYLRKVAAITDFWDFGGYNDITMNPYNFFDWGHCYYEVADLVIDTVAGKDSYEGFGYHVTPENVNEYLKERQAQFEKLKQEYLETGTVALGSMEDESWIQ